jgi:hypothetical protein
MVTIPLLRMAVHRLLGRAFGPPGFDAGTHTGDPGLFGPGSPSWQIIGDQASIVGGLRGLLVQLLHPLAVAGVATHSRYRDDAVDRLHRTASYVGGTTFGATAEVLALAHVVRRAHRDVSGTAPDGRTYRADDPHLLAWISIALTSSFLAAHRAYGRARLTRAEQGRFVAEQSRGAALLDPRVDLEALSADPAEFDRLRSGRLPLPMLDEGRLPQSVTELEQILESYRDELQVGPPGREALRFLLWPDLDPVLKAGYLPVLAGAIATLRPHERRLLGLPPVGPLAPATRLSTRVGMTGLRAAVGPSPALRAATERARTA